MIDSLLRGHPLLEVVNRFREKTQTGRICRIDKPGLYRKMMPVILPVIADDYGPAASDNTDDKPFAHLEHWVSHDEV